MRRRSENIEIFLSGIDDGFVALGGYRVFEFESVVRRCCRGDSETYVA